MPQPGNARLPLLRHRVSTIRFCAVTVWERWYGVPVTPDRRLPVNRLDHLDQRKDGVIAFRYVRNVGNTVLEHRCDLGVFIGVLTLPRDVGSKMFTTPDRELLSCILRQGSGCTWNADRHQKSRHQYQYLF